MEANELTLKEIQQVSLSVLKTVTEICGKLKLSYFLAYGTLIGAIRHKGFIPWDDDIDIMMPRTDYNKLIAYFLAHEEELYPLKLFSIYNNKKYPYMITRVSDDNYVLDVYNELPFGLGIFIDIYPIDGVGNSVDKYTKLKKQATHYSSLCFLSTRLKCTKGNTKSRWKMMIKFPAFVYSKLRGRDYWINKLENMAKNCDYDNSEYIGCLIWGSDGAKGIFPKKWFSQAIDVQFEDAFFKAPCNYDAVLKRLYGNYMQLPMEKDRNAHHFYRAYKK